MNSMLGFIAQSRQALLHFTGASYLAAAECMLQFLQLHKPALPAQLAAVQQSKSSSHASLSSGKKVTLAVICLTMAWISDVISEAGFSGGRLHACLRLHQDACSPLPISQQEVLHCQARALGCCLSMT